jgi:NAD(P)-dependent dehydrogenase (short-subunit alcohol dehydrogenase family)
MQVDVTDSAQLERLVKAVIDQFNRLDILVSNAGANVFEGAEACTEEQWTYNQELNLHSHWRLAKLCKPFLETDSGVIIIMTSNHAFASIPGCFPYNVAKAGLTALVRSLAIEWGPSIRTVGLAPGFIDTPGNRNWFASFPDPALERKRTEDMHPVKRIGTPEEVGAWCVFLASEYATFASGITYLVDGGRSALMQDPAG